MASLEDVTKLKKKVDILRSRVEQAKGEANSIRRTLKDEWECSNLTEAKALLEKLKKKEETLQTQFDTKMKQFQDQWKDELSAVG